MTVKVLLKQMLLGLMLFYYHQKCQNQIQSLSHIRKIIKITIFSSSFEYNDPISELESVTLHELLYSQVELFLRGIQPYRTVGNDKIANQPPENQIDYRVSVLLILG